MKITHIISQDQTYYPDLENLSPSKRDLYSLLIGVEGTMTSIPESSLKFKYRVFNRVASFTFYDEYSRAIFFSVCTFDSQEINANYAIKAIKEVCQKLELHEPENLPSAGPFMCTLPLTYCTPQNENDVKIAEIYIYDQLKNKILS